MLHVDGSDGYSRSLGRLHLGRRERSSSATSGCGGVAAECEATDRRRAEELLLYDTETGNELASGRCPVRRARTENCTLRRDNLFRFESGRVCS